jgi:dihydrolipoamide dehydrogenase
MVAGDQSDPVDVLIIGAGPGGYVAALRAAQLGRSVTVVEARRVGGVCLNEGCIPSKQLARFAAVFSSVKAFAGSGMPPLSGPPDMAAFQVARASAVNTLVGGVEALFKSAGVALVSGEARFVGRTRVCVQTAEDSVRFFDFKDVVIATGSEPIPWAAAPFDGERVVDASRALEWDRVPQSLLVVGDDYIAVETAVAWSRLGSRVTLAAPLDRLLPELDADLSAAAFRGARHAGIEVALNTVPGDPGDHEKVVVSMRRRARFDHLDLAAAGIRTPSPAFEGDPQMRLDRHVFAIGDVTRGFGLAHTAMMQGRVAGDVLGGKNSAFDARAVPIAVFAEPEIATVGRSEGLVARFPLGALGRAVIEARSTAGFAKLVFDGEEGPLVGAHLAGPRATDLIAEMALAIEMGATAEDLALTVHAHPTFAEQSLEAAEVSLGRPIHVRPQRPAR